MKLPGNVNTAQLILLNFSAPDFRLPFLLQITTRYVYYFLSTSSDLSIF